MSQILGLENSCRLPQQVGETATVNLNHDLARSGVYWPWLKGDKKQNLSPVLALQV